MLDVVSIGAVNVDLIGRVNRFPVADEEVAVQELEILHGGSAANVAVGVSRLGHSSGFVGVIGTDNFGNMLNKKLRKEKVDTSYLTEVEGSSGIVFGVINPDGERILYTSKGASSNFDRPFIPVEYIKKTRFLHLTGIIGEKAIDALEFASGIAYENNVRVIFDPGSILAEQGVDALKGILGNCRIMIPNRIEAEMLTGLKEERAGKKLLEYGPEVVIVTQGSKGSLLITRDLAKNIPAIKTKAIDTTGAGDSFAAGLISSLLENKGLREATEFASLIASMSVTRMGARTTPYKAEVADYR